MGDLLILKRLLTGELAPSALELNLGDMNADDELDLGDMLLLEQIILNWGAAL
ncbi:MAG: hypothetical protein ACI9B9_000461 [Halioglobus sp.]